MRAGFDCKTPLWVSVFRYAKITEHDLRAGEINRVATKAGQEGVFLFFKAA